MFHNWFISHWSVQTQRSSTGTETLRILSAAPHSLERGGEDEIKYEHVWTIQEFRFIENGSKDSIRIMTLLEPHMLYITH